MSALDALSEYCGIVSSFVDATGETRTTSKETQIALLSAMGFEVSAEASAQRALDGIQEEERARVLPSVYVHDVAQGPLQLDLEGRARPGQAWRIDFDDGVVLEGELVNASKWRARRGTEAFVVAAHALLGRTNCAVAMLQLDDLPGEVDPVNQPTTSTEYPNWRRRSSDNFASLSADERFLSAVKTRSAIRNIRRRLRGTAI